MAVNDMIMHFPHIDHAFSNGRDLVYYYAKARRENLNHDFQTHALESSKGQKPVDHLWDLPGHGTSGLNAVYAGLEMYDEILLAGVPLDNTGHYWEAPWMVSNFENEVPLRDGKMKYWERARDEIFEGRVKSLSGRTKDLLNGTPISPRSSP